MKIKTSITSQLLQSMRRFKKFQFGGTLERELSYKLNCKPSYIARELRRLARAEKIDKTYEAVGSPAKRVVLYKGK